jgi:hypothetical protein
LGQVQFQPDGNYRNGDYWLIPVRIEMGDIEWPQQADKTAAKMPPHGKEHHCAPLAVISFDGNGNISIDHDCRRTFDHLAIRRGGEH